MNDSLSIILPVCDAEASLAGQVARLLDVLPDLTGRFEIVLVDDASTDHTLDLARELAAQFPQLRVIRHRDRRGIAAAVRTGLQWASGRTVFVQEHAASLSSSDLRRLWSLRDDQELVLARASLQPRVFDKQLLARLTQWGQSLPNLAAEPSGAGGIHMIRRGAIERLLADDVADDPPAIAPPPIPSHTRADQSHQPAGPPRGATFLRHLKNLALGE